MDSLSHWTSFGNEVTLMDDGDAIFRWLWHTIEQAKRRIWIEVYLFKNDFVGHRSLDLLQKASQRGCEVILIYDSFGSLPETDKTFNQLRAAGAEVFAYNPVWPLSKIRQKCSSLIRRDHRKIMIIDDFGLTGGLNISEEYAGKELGNAYFADTMLLIKGPAVRHLAEVFLESLPKNMNRDRQLPGPPAPDGNTNKVQVLKLDSGTGSRTLSKVLARAINNAQRKCLIASAYFVPPEWFKRAVIEAAQRGVQVQILTAGQSDVPAARIAGRHLYGDFLNNGIRIFEMQQPVLHAKYFTIDGLYSSVGSYNIDHWSKKHNLEINIAVEGGNLAENLENLFHKSLKQSREMDLHTWRNRTLPQKISQWALYHLSGK